MLRMTRRELLAGAIAPGLAACSTARRQNRSSVTVLYGDSDRIFAPDYDESAKFLVFRRIGVRMDVTLISDFGLVDSRIKSGEFDAAIMEGPLGRLRGLLRGAGYNSPSFFGLLGRLETPVDPEEKDMLIRELTRISQADVPLTYLHPFVVTTIASTRIRGLDGSPYSGDLVQCMDELWLEETN